jgi:HSP20 family protein
VAALPLGERKNKEVPMLGSWSDFERTFAAMDDLRRKVEQALNDGQANGEAYDVFDGGAGARWPRVTLWDAGPHLMLKADIPGVNEKDLNLQLTNDVLTVSGERRVVAPEGYSVHRQERTPSRFSRSFTLPCRVNPETIGAALKDGVLTVTLPKAPESQPRQITVKVS